MTTIKEQKAKGLTIPEVDKMEKELRELTPENYEKIVDIVLKPILIANQIPVPKERDQIDFYRVVEDGKFQFRTEGEYDACKQALLIWWMHTSSESEDNPIAKLGGEMATEMEFKHFLSEVYMPRLRAFVENPPQHSWGGFKGQEQEAPKATDSKQTPDRVK